MERVSASIIIPTFNRFATLGRAILSARNQCVQDVEIIVVLDGAPSQCRDVAGQHAVEDSRVRILDFPKAPGRGHDNCDKAVRSARSEKILYCDDDDLLLPSHVKVLGGLLDRADVAETRVASLDRRGSLHLTPCPSSNSRTRQLLADGKLKFLFDTHFGHTAQAYGRFSSWTEAFDHSVNPVAGFLSGFASVQDCRWASDDRVTAISLHGAARKDMTAAQRSDEIDAWFGKISSDGQISGELENANSIIHLYALLRADPPRGASFDEYLSERGAYNDVTKDKNAQNLFKLINKEAIPADNASKLAAILLQPLLGGYSFAFMRLMKRVYGRDEAAQIAKQAAFQAEENLAGPMAAFAQLQTGFGRKESAVQAISDALEIGPDPRGDLAKIKRRMTQTSLWTRMWSRVFEKAGKHN